MRTTTISPALLLRPTRWMKKSEVVSPMPVVSALTIQKIAVTSGTFTKVLRSICTPRVSGRRTRRGRRVSVEVSLHRTRDVTQGKGVSLAFTAVTSDEPCDIEGIVLVG